MFFCWKHWSSKEKSISIGHFSLLNGYVLRGIIVVTSKNFHYGGEIPQNHRRFALFKSPQMGIIHIAIGNWLNANWTLELPNAQAMVLSQTPCCSRSIGESSPRNSTNQGHLLVFLDAFFCTFDLQKSSYDVATDGSHDQSDTASHGSWGDTWDANLEYHTWDANLKLVDTNGLIMQLPNSQVAQVCHEDRHWPTYSWCNTGIGPLCRERGL